MKFQEIAILLLFFFVAAPAAASNPALSSRGLEQRIDFWKKVYVQYGADDVIIHDRFHVNLIYDVATEETQEEKIAEIQNALREIRSNLGTPENLGPTAATIYESIAAQGLPLSFSLVDDLIANIHTQIGIKEQFRAGVIRSGRYVEKFREIMASHGVPTELALLPLVESGFRNARSKAGAVGVWQFTFGTGKQYLTINRWMDERLDAVRSSEAAAKFLRANYRALGTWPLAITAYNHGREGMLQAQEKHGSDLPAIIEDYRGPVFGYASMNFYSEFLAAVDVYKNHRQHFGELTLDSPVLLSDEDPPLRSYYLPARRTRTPAARYSGRKAAGRKASLSARRTHGQARKATGAAVARYKVRKGDTLTHISRRTGVPVRHLMAKNKLKKSNIRAGQVLRVKQTAKPNRRRSGLALR